MILDNCFFVLKTNMPHYRAHKTQQLTIGWWPHGFVRFRHWLLTVLDVITEINPKVLTRIFYPSNIKKKKKKRMTMSPDGKCSKKDDDDGTWSGVRFPSTLRTHKNLNSKHIWIVKSQNVVHFFFGGFGCLCGFCYC